MRLVQKKSAKVSLQMSEWSAVVNRFILERVELFSELLTSGILLPG